MTMTRLYILLGVLATSLALEEALVRDKRDVLKGGRNDPDLVRTKRYIGRMPVSYMKKNVQPSYPAPGYQGVSHFRENNPTHTAAAEEGEFPSNLTDEEIQTLLIMLDGADANRHRSPVRPRLGAEDYYAAMMSSPSRLERVAQMYNVGKRETGKRAAVLNYEQPMSFDNALEDKIEFLHQQLGGKPKRVGARNLMNPKSRTEREATPLDQVFSPNGLEFAPPKAKKEIDWSEYFGIDKRAQSGQKDSVKPETTSPPPDTTKASASASKPNSKLVAIPLTSTNEKEAKGAGKKDQERRENETTDKKNEEDWMLQQFYKNFAMMTNVKRKRASPSIPHQTELERLDELEREMTQVGDKIIWDTLKYTGAHRDQDLSPQEMEKLRANVVGKLSTAYSLEKARDAIDELRQKIAQLNTSPQLQP